MRLLEASEDGDRDVEAAKLVAGDGAEATVLHSTATIHQHHMLTCHRHANTNTTQCHSFSLHQLQKGYSLGI